MTTSPGTTFDVVLHHARQLDELIRAVSLGRDPRAVPVVLDFALKLATLEQAELQNAMLADIAESLRGLSSVESIDAPGDLGARQVELAMGASPTVLADLLGATERRLDQAQDTITELRRKLAAYEPLPPVGVPVAAPEESPR